MSSRSSGAAFLGSMLFTRFVSGTRVVPRGQAKTVAGVKFTGYGASVTGYPHDYLTAACAVGLSAAELADFSSRLEKAIRKAKGGETKGGDKGNPCEEWQSDEADGGAVKGGVGAIGLAGEACAATAGSARACEATSALLPTVEKGVPETASCAREKGTATVAAAVAAGLETNRVSVSNAGEPKSGGDGLGAGSRGAWANNAPGMGGLRREANSGLFVEISSANSRTPVVSNGSGIRGNAGAVFTTGGGNGSEDKPDKIGDIAGEDWDDVD